MATENLNLPLATHGIQALRQSLEDGFKKIDAKLGAITAAEISFDPGASGMTADNLQDAIIELHTAINA